MTSVFTKIIKGELPSYKIHEDEYTFSFLALDQIQLGHTLIVPKVEVDHFLDVPEPIYSRVFQNAQQIGKALMKVTGCKRIGTIIQGWEVPHFHYHVIPMYDPSDLNFSKAKRRTEEEMKNVQQKILAQLKSK